jgi:hypothetical protein
LFPYGSGPSEVGTSIISTLEQYNQRSETRYAICWTINYTIGSTACLGLYVPVMDDQRGTDSGHVRRSMGDVLELELGSFQGRIRFAGRGLCIFYLCRHLSRAGDNEGIQCKGELRKGSSLFVPRRGKDRRGFGREVCPTSERYFAQGWDRSANTALCRFRVPGYHFGAPDVAEAFV